MQFFNAAQGKESLVAAALEASMRSVRQCGANASEFDLEEHQVLYCDILNVDDILWYTWSDVALLLLLALVC